MSNSFYVCLRTMSSSISPYFLQTKRFTRARALQLQSKSKGTSNLPHAHAKRETTQSSTANSDLSTNEVARKSASFDSKHSSEPIVIKQEPVESKCSRQHTPSSDLSTKEVTHLSASFDSKPSEEPIVIKREPVESKCSKQQTQCSDLSIKEVTHESVSFESKHSPEPNVIKQEPVESNFSIIKQEPVESKFSINVKINECANSGRQFRCKKRHVKVEYDNDHRGDNGTNLQNTESQNEIKAETSSGDNEKQEMKKVKWEPEHWKQHLENIYEMRKFRNAPVDTMGCDRISDLKAEPQVCNNEFEKLNLLKRKKKKKNYYMCLLQASPKYQMES